MELSERRLRDRRKAAGLVDLVLVAIAAMPACVLLYGHSFTNSPPVLWHLPALALSTAIVTLHEVVMQRSLGKVLMGLYLQRRLHGAVGPLRIAMRCLLKYAPAYGVLLVMWVTILLEHLRVDVALRLWESIAPLAVLAMLLTALGSWISMVSRLGVALHDWLTDTRVCADIGESRGFPVEPGK